MVLSIYLSHSRSICLVTNCQFRIPQLLEVPFKRRRRPWYSSYPTVFRWTKPGYDLQDYNKFPYMGKNKKGAAISEDCLLLPPHPFQSQADVRTPIADTLSPRSPPTIRSSGTRGTSLCSSSCVRYARATACGLSSTCIARHPCSRCGGRSRTRPWRRNGVGCYGVESSAGLLWVHAAVSPVSATSL